MDDNDFKKTYNVFTKLVFWSTLTVIVVLVLLALILL